jgi:hypothetical protein
MRGSLCTANRTFVARVAYVELVIVGSVWLQVLRFDLHRFSLCKFSQRGYSIRYLDGVVNIRRRKHFAAVDHFGHILV